MAFCKLSLFSFPVWNHLLAPKSVTELHSLCAKQQVLAAQSLLWHPSKWPTQSTATHCYTFTVFKMHRERGTRSPFPPLCKTGISFPQSAFSLRGFEAPLFYGGNAALFLLVLWNPTSREAFAVSRFPVRPSVEGRSLKPHGDVGSKNTTAEYHITEWIPHPGSEENIVV